MKDLLLIIITLLLLYIYIYCVGINNMLQRHFAEDVPEQTVEIVSEYSVGKRV